MSVFLETERLVLRRFTPDDVANLVALDSDPDVRRYVDMPNAPTYAEAEATLHRFLAWYERHEHYGFWAAIEKSEAKAEETLKEVEKAGETFVGWFHFRPFRPNPEEIELGYRLKKAFWGRGYATEVAEALVRKGFVELNVPRIVATALEDNIASWRVMEKIGMTLETRYLYDNRLPAVKYGLNREDYF